jgi:muramidase (phage lysozyme)
VVTIALVASYSLAGDEGQEVALDTEGGARIVASPRPTEAPTSTISTVDDDVQESSDEVGAGTTEQVSAVYQIGLSDIGDSGSAAFDLELLSNPPEEPPAAPTTEAPTTTVATTAAPETTVAADVPESSTSIVEDTSDTTEADPTAEAPADPAAEAPAETTVPEETTTTAAPAQPDGYVDAGHGVLVPAVLVEIRRCESTHNYQAANPRSTARGAYQFLRSSWAAYGHADRYGVSEAHLATNAQQDEAALITWQRDGTRPWNASRSCWG